jgi:hypothetical protein
MLQMHLEMTVDLFFILKNIKIYIFLIILICLYKTYY